MFDDSDKKVATGKQIHVDSLEIESSILEDSLLFVPDTSIIWIETEIRRLYAEREDWRNRWQDLKHWLSTHRNSLDWNTITAITHQMDELEKTATLQFTIMTEDTIE